MFHGVRSPHAPHAEQDRARSRPAPTWPGDSVELPVADHGELDVGPRGARPLRAPLRDERDHPRRALRQMQKARTFRAANMQMRQLGFAEVDLSLHMDFEPARDGDVIAYARAIVARFSHIAPPDDYADDRVVRSPLLEPVGYATAVLLVPVGRGAGRRRLLAIQPRRRAQRRGRRRVQGARALAREQPGPEGALRGLHGPRGRIEALFARSGLL